MVKKAMLFFVSFAAVMMLASFSAHAEEPISVVLDGRTLAFNVPPTIINGSTMVPMRAIFEALGADVSWDSATKTAIGVKDGVTVEIIIGSRIMLKNGAAITLNSPAVIINGNTLVPTRAIAESFGCGVNWDGGTRTVIITSMPESGDYNSEENNSLPDSDYPYADDGAPYSDEHDAEDGPSYPNEYDA